MRALRVGFSLPSLRKAVWKTRAFYQDHTPKVSLPFWEEVMNGCSGKVSLCHWDALCDALEVDG